MNMLNLLKKISNRLNFIFYTHSSRYKLRYLYSYDRKRFIRHAGSLHHEEKEQKLASVIMAYHVVEKGLSMPERRLGFGHDAVLELISLIRNYSEKFPQNDQILHAISVLDAYREMHRKENFSLRPDLQQALDSLLADFPPCGQGRRSDRNNQGTILCPFGILLSRIFGIPPFRASLQWPGFTGTNRTGRIPCPQCPICLQQAAYPRPLHL